MKHVAALSRTMPLRAQFAPVIEFVNMISAIVGLFQQLASTFGFDIPTKE